MNQAPAYEIASLRSLTIKKVACPFYSNYSTVTLLARLRG